MMLSKKKYFSQLFEGEHGRECKLAKYGNKAKKYLNNHIVFMADFLQGIGAELSEDEAELVKVIFQARKVDCNIYSLSKESGERLSGTSKDKIYA
jgi:hypothetical protein